MSHQCGMCLTDAMVVDLNGCELPDGHPGPHEFKDSKGKVWCWITDLECTCEHCMQCEGDYCTEYWPKVPVKTCSSCDAQSAAEAMEMCNAACGEACPGIALFPINTQVARVECNAGPGAT